MKGKSVKTVATASELEKLRAYFIVDIIQYAPNAVISKTILKKITGNVIASSLEAGEQIAEKTSPFDTFIHIIDGTAEISVNDKKFMLELGEGIIIPAHARQCFHAKEQFKMISTTIKSGYED